MSWGYAVSIMLSGMANASTLFLVASGLSLIFGVSRIVNFAHGSFYMLGAYLAYSLISYSGASLVGLIFAVIGSCLILGLFGALIEFVLLRRLYASPQLFQLLATFGLSLLISDLVLFVWGPESLLGPRIHGLGGAIQVFGRSIPTYDFVVIGAGPVIFTLLWWLLNRTFWGILVRAATEDREMVSALGVNHSILFTSVFSIWRVTRGIGWSVTNPSAHRRICLWTSHPYRMLLLLWLSEGWEVYPGALLASVIVGMARAICMGVPTITVL